MSEWSDEQKVWAERVDEAHTPLPPQRFRKKPVEVQAVQLRWTTWNEVCDFLGDRGRGWRMTDEVSDACGEIGPYIELTIPTLEGDMIARHGDWIIRGIKGELYPCKPDIFEASYDAVELPSGHYRA